MKQKLEGVKDNPFKKAYDICDAMGGRILISDERLKQLIEEHLEEWVPILFNAARSKQGRERIRFASTLKVVFSYADETRLSSVLENLMTNKDVVDELINTGFREATPVQEIKRWFKDRKKD